MWSLRADATSGKEVVRRLLSQDWCTEHWYMWAVQGVGRQARRAVASEETFTFPLWSPTPNQQKRDKASHSLGSGCGGVHGGPIF